MINIIFGLLTIIGIIYSFITGKTDDMSNIILGSASKSFELCINIFTFMCLWLGIINIAKNSGLLDKLTYIFKPLLKRLFPEIPDNHESLNYISTNFITNMFGLGNASTPFAIKAMNSLQELNKSNIASNSMITFLILNTAGLTIIPTSILAIRSRYGSNISIICITLISSFISLLVALIINYLFRKVFK